MKTNELYFGFAHLKISSKSVLFKKYLMDWLWIGLMSDNYFPTLWKEAAAEVMLKTTEMVQKNPCDFEWVLMIWTTS